MLFDKEQPGVNEDAVTMVALDAGAEDVRDEGDSLAVITAPAEFEAVKAAFEAQGVPVAHSELTRIPRNTVPVGPEDGGILTRLLEVLEDYDDVQNVYANNDPLE
jgi:transcriptional/translational regulatory protein YebC/TACO1